MSISPNQQSLAGLPNGIFWVSLAVTLTIRDTAVRNPTSRLYTRRLVWTGERRCISAFAIIIGAASLFHTEGKAYHERLFCWMASFAIFVAMSRYIVGFYLDALQRDGMLRETIAVIGTQGPSERLADRLASSVNIVGVYDVHPSDHVSKEDMACLLELGRAGTMDSIVVANETEASENVAQIVEKLKIVPVEVALCAQQDWLQLPAPEVRVVGGIPVTVLVERPIERHDLLMKTILDKIVSLSLLILLAPLMLAIALTVKLTSRGSIIFNQKREGWCGKSFIVHKFRTMREPPDGVNWSRQTERNDERCTFVGRFLRRTSLDELPQLWNVLRGDMSLVGPRPHAESFHAADWPGKQVVAQYAQRYRVKPGITGWAQIHGARGATRDTDQLRQRVAYDLYYIEHWSLWLDLQILGRTVFCFFGENAF
jgi:Undecaprenyl-phosphate glucose phosphotransferase